MSRGPVQCVCDLCGAEHSAESPEIFGVQWSITMGDTRARTRECEAALAKRHICLGCLIDVAEMHRRHLTSPRGPGEA